MKVLLVDDDRLGRVMLAQSLRARDLNVTEAESAAEALACWDADRYDYVISDILMPEVDGMELAARIRRLQDQDSTRRHTRLVALTASITGPDDENQIRQLFDVVLHKPIPAEALHQVLTDGAAPGESPAPDKPAG